MDIRKLSLYLIAATAISGSAAAAPAVATPQNEGGFTALQNVET